MIPKEEFYALARLWTKNQQNTVANPAAFFGLHFDFCNAVDELYRRADSPFFDARVVATPKEDEALIVRWDETRESDDERAEINRNIAELESNPQDSQAFFIIIPKGMEVSISVLKAGKAVVK